MKQFNTQSQGSMSLANREIGKKSLRSDALTRRLRGIDKSKAADDRQGAVIVFAMIALLVASMMIAALLRTTMVSLRQMKRDEFRVQANLLADAGCSRATVRLNTQSDFTDEIWTVPSDQLGSGRTAEVRLTVANNPMKPGERILSVVAEFPIGHPDRVRVSRQLSVP